MRTHLIQNVSLLRWYKRSRYLVYRSIRKVPWKYVIGATVATPFIAIIQGTNLLHGTLYILLYMDALLE
jgi:hypothetical protein